MDEVAVRIEQVELLGEAERDLAGFRLACPKAGADSHELELEVRGWVVPEGRRAESIEIVSGGECVARTPVDIPRRKLPPAARDLPQGENAGFNTAIGALRLPPRFSLQLLIRNEDGSSIDLARIHGERAGIPGGEPEGMQPAFISSPTGRTGTTWIVHLLAHHPELVAYPLGGVEPRPATYWLEVALALAEPASYKRALRTHLERPQWWLGDWPEASRDQIANDAMRRFLARDQVMHSATWAREQVQRFYRAVAEDEEKSDPRYFVEKGPLGSNKLEVMDDIYPGLREIVMVRDPRDTLCSILAYQQRKTRVSLVTESPNTDGDYLEAVRDSFLGLISQTKERQGQSLLVRYEDLILEPEGTLEAIFTHLGIDASGHAINGVIAGANDGPDRFEQHRTSVGIEQSIGRWRHDLDPALRDRVNDLFAPVLESLGYVGTRVANGNGNGNGNGHGANGRRNGTNGARRNGASLAEKSRRSGTSASGANVA